MLCGVIKVALFLTFHVFRFFLNMLTCAAVSGGDQALVISPELYMPQTAGNGPIHTAHAVADLNQSEMRNAAIFSANFCLTRWYHKK